MSPKHLIVCCDGTWQTKDQTYPTNVARIFKAFDNVKNEKQIAYHDNGVGTANIFSKIFGGAFGWGLDKNILEAYQFLCNHFAPGDHIYCFGFSRGAYTVRSLCGLLYKCGLVRTGKPADMKNAMSLYRNREIKPDDPESVTFRNEFSYQNSLTNNRPWITFLGCWDTVGSLGVPDLSEKFALDKFLNKKYRFYDTELSFIVKHARHAVSLDEKRKVFDITPMDLSNKARGKTDLKQIWFAGDHGCIGGGELNNQLQSSVTLNWMVDELRNCNEPQLPEIDLKQIPQRDQLKPDAPLVMIITDFYKKMGLIDRDGPDNFDNVHWSVKVRLLNDHNYCPTPLDNRCHDAILALRTENTVKTIV
jgi:uncharacterized protein (DUF2235 family)